MRKVTIEKKFSTMSLNEIFQSSGIKMAFLKQSGPYSYEQYMPLVQCRDYFSDTIWARNGGIDTTIYGFSTNGVEYDDKHTCLLVVLPKHSDRTAFKNNYKSFADKIKSLGGGKVSVLQDKDNPLHLVVKAHKWWQSTVVTMSLFTMLARWIPQVSDWSSWDFSFIDTDPDKKYSKTIGKYNLDALILNRKKIFNLGPISDKQEKCKEDTSEVKSYIHNFGGIYNWSNMTSASYTYYKKYKEYADA